MKEHLLEEVDLARKEISSGGKSAVFAQISKLPLTTKIPVP
jgi:hypothetical protein